MGLVGEQFQFCLFVVGEHERSQRAIRQAQALCRQLPEGCSYHLRIVNVLQDPDLAESYKVLATPTLLRLTPLPPRRVVGDLADSERVLWMLDVLQAPPRIM